MALVMPESGHIAIAKALKEEEFWLGIGTLPEGVTPWGVDEEPPPFDTSADRLLAPVGYRKATQVLFAKEEPNGVIVAAGKRWSTTNEPTRHLYVAAHLDNEDAVGQTIYQVGLFIRLKPKEGVSEGELFLTPDKVADTGTLLVAENVRPFFRQQGIREVFEFVLTF